MERMEFKAENIVTATENNKNYSSIYRKSYIFLYNKDNIRYIWNRSVNWESQLSKKELGVLEILGFGNISKSLDKFFKIHSLVCENVSNIENILTNEGVVILGIYNDLPNYDLKDQLKLNKLKEDFAVKYNAVTRIDGINENELEDMFIIKKIKKYINDICDKIYDLEQSSRKRASEVYYNSVKYFDEATEDYKDKKRKECIDYKNKMMYECESVKKHCAIESKRYLDNLEKRKWVLENKDVEDTILLRQKINREAEKYETRD